MTTTILIIKEVQSAELSCITGIISAKSQILLKINTDDISKIISDNNSFFVSIILLFFLPLSFNINFSPPETAQEIAAKKPGQQ